MFHNYICVFLVVILISASLSFSREQRRRRRSEDGSDGYDENVCDSYLTAFYKKYDEMEKLGEIPPCFPKKNFTSSEEGEEFKSLEEDTTEDDMQSTTYLPEEGGESEGIEVDMAEFDACYKKAKNIVKEKMTEKPSVACEELMEEWENNEQGNQE